MATLKAKAQRILNEKIDNVTPASLKYGNRAYGVTGSIESDEFNGSIVSGDPFVELYLVNNEFYGGTDIQTKFESNDLHNLCSYGKFKFHPDANTGCAINCIIMHKNYFEEANYVDVDEWGNFIMPTMCLQLFMPREICSEGANYWWKFGISKIPPYFENDFLYSISGDEYNSAIVFAYPNKVGCTANNESYTIGLYLDDDIIDSVKTAFMGMADSNIDTVYNGTGFYLVDASREYDEDTGNVTINYDFTQKILQDVEVPYNHFWLEVPDFSAEILSSYIQSASSSGEIVEASLAGDFFVNKQYYDIINIFGALKFGGMLAGMEPYNIKLPDTSIFDIISISADYRADIFANPSKYRIKFYIFAGYNEDTGEEEIRALEPILLSEFDVIDTSTIIGTAHNSGLEIDLNPYGVSTVGNIINWEGEYVITVEHYNDSTGDWEELSMASERFKGNDFTPFFGINRALFTINDVGDR